MEFNFGDRVRVYGPERPGTKGTVLAVADWAGAALVRGDGGWQQWLPVQSLRLLPEPLEPEFVVYGGEG